MAGRPIVMRLSQNSETRGNTNDAKLVARFLDDRLRAARLGWRKKNSIRCARNVFLRSKNADVRFHLVVVRREVFVCDRPVIAHAISRARFEIDRSKAKRNASPMVRAPAFDARSEPAKSRSRGDRIRFAFNVPRSVRREEFAEIGARPAAH